MNMNRLFALMVIGVAMSLIATSAFAAPIPIRIDEVRVDDFVLQPNELNRLDIQRGQEVPVDIKLTALNDTKNVEVEAFISGFEFGDIEPISDATRIFDADANVSYIKRLRIRVSDDVNEDDYKLRIIISDRNSDQLIQTYSLKLDVPRHSLRLEDVIFTPQDTVLAGKALLATVRLENKGEKREDDIRVTVSIPELGVQATDYIDELRVDDEEETEEIFLKIPESAKSGRYLARVDVEFQQRHNKLTASKTINVIGKEETDTGVSSAPKALITIESQLASAQIGRQALFPITIQNNFPQSRIATVTVSGADGFGEVFVAPSSVMVIDSKDVKIFTISVTPFDDVEPGTYVFKANVKVGDTISKEIPLTLNVQEDENANLWMVRKVLEGLLVAFVILLVVIGIVVAFRRRNEDKKESSITQMQTYY
ncbi:hypothetical protein HY641_02380 [Candidatus Woesearchaeota archaeon]|nr:hypothetical protein [Candidatus Woesearchaeota archaeon]